MFCETSRHLAKEKTGLKCGNKPLDTSLGLVNIIREYFLFKSRVNEFLRTCPKSPIIIKIIDTEDTVLRLDIILETLRENLSKIDKIPAENPKKRKYENDDDEFDISQNNTSTPESNAPKRSRKSLTPFLTLSGNKEIKTKTVDKSALYHSELNFPSSDDTSEKEDEDEELPHASLASQTLKAIPGVSWTLRKCQTFPFQTFHFQQLTETVLNNPSFVDKITDIINQTRQGTEEDGGNQCDLDLDHIMSQTQNEPGFEEILRNLIEGTTQGLLQQESEVQTSTSSEKLTTESENALEIPIKQRLRQRSARKLEVRQGSERKKKFNIISDELILPLPVADPIDFNIPVMVPVMQNQPSIIAVTSSVLALDPCTSTNPAVLYQPILPEMVTEPPEMVTEEEKQRTTPKITLYPSFLESKCKSTPRRKETHVRILDFNQTPTHRRLSTVKEFSTPAGCDIPSTTPGSAPASVSLAKFKSTTSEIPTLAGDDNSNSNSISNTPKVAKNRRRRKIAVTKVEERPTTVKVEEEQLETPFSIDDWQNMRTQSKRLGIDEQVRLNVQAEHLANLKKRKSPRKRKAKKRLSVPKKKKVKSKSPDEKENASLKTDSFTSTEYDENKPLSTMKFKIASPRKAAALKKSPGKKKKSIVERAKEKFEKQEKDVADAEENVVEVQEPLEVEAVPSEMNRSDTIEAATTLLMLKTSDEGEQQPQVDSGFQQTPLLETPFKDMLDFKDLSLTPLPNTPRFAIPLTAGSNETPMPKIFCSETALVSVIKPTDIFTPICPITPGSVVSPPSQGGYSSRRTDYSSSSSYYKPDESEEINQKINALIGQRRSERNSQSESDGGCVHQVKLVGSARKVECPGAIERIRSFTEELPNTPHYTMMEDCVLSESVLTTATDDSSNSSNSSTSSSNFTCSTCSTSADENTMDKLEKATTSEEKDSEWRCDDQPEVEQEASSVVNEKTGEVRFPLRNWFTPKKLEVTADEETKRIKSMLHANNAKVGLSVEEERERLLREMEAKKQRTLAKIKQESAASRPVKPDLKFKKNNVKCFKLPAEDGHKPAFVSRKDQILQKNLTERPRPTPLKLIPGSSSRRKNATPRKTIVIDELPRQPSPTKKKKPAAKSPSKVDRLSLESVSDNAIMPGDSSSLNISSSFHSSFESETVVANKRAPTDEGSNTFQQTLMAQGFDKDQAKELQAELVDKLEQNQTDGEKLEIPPEEKQLSDSESGSEDGSEEDFDFCLADDHEKNSFDFAEPKNFQPRDRPTALAIPQMILRFDDRTVTLRDSDNIDLFTMEPTMVDKAKKSSPKKSADEKKQPKTNGKESPGRNGKSKSSSKNRWDQSKTVQKETALK